MKINSYIVRRWKGGTLELAGRVFDPAEESFCSQDCAAISNYVWDPQGYCPEARAYLAYTDDALLLLMCANEATIVAGEKRFGGAVCRDSCLEFFLNPRPKHGDQYINIEINAAGTAHIGIGAGRHGRRVLSEMPEDMQISVSIHNGAWWAVSCSIPRAFIRSQFGGDIEDEMQANFYTCDETIHPHFGTWNPVAAPQPDFHRPECFGRLKLEA